MAKKIFVHQAHIVKGSRWKIDYTTLDPTTGQERRHRNEFGLNSVPLEIREQVAGCLLKCVEKVLRGIPQAPTPAPIGVESMPMAEAVELALKIKTAGPMENTHKNYRTIGRYLLEWIEARSYARLPVSEFGRRQARAFFDWYITRKPLRGVTINNRLIHLRALWSELVDRELCVEKHTASTGRRKIEAPVYPGRTGNCGPRS